MCCYRPNCTPLTRARPEGCALLALCWKSCYLLIGWVSRVSVFAGLLGQSILGP